MNKQQQREILVKSGNLVEWEVVELKTEELRIKKIMEIYDSNPKIIDSLLATPLNKEFNLRDSY